ncbi:DUF3310 domain-containing protein [Streptomyces sp. S1]|uniref:DUF3310 domain-containing protein n=1 Tax=Streptomyces sp. S1 TaxID=718288 RepID=UPI003D717528
MALRIMKRNPDPAEAHSVHGSGAHEWSADCDDAPPCQPLDTSEAARLYDPPPSHYAAESMQPWDVIDAFGLDYYLGSVFKYLARAGKKDIAPRLDDLRKARNFLSRAIELEETRRSPS